MEFSIVPIGKEESVSPYVAECVLIVRESGLPYKLCPMGTLIEGEYDEVMDVVRKCHMRVMGMCSRAITTVKIDDRKGFSDMLSQKIRSVEKRLDSGTG